MSQDSVIIDPELLQRLLEELRERGYRTMGPTVHEDVIVLDEIETAAELPIAWTERQEPASYRLEQRTDEARFGFTVGPQSWKRWFFPPSLRLWSSQRVGNSFSIAPQNEELSRYAFIGVRPCDLEAIKIQDMVFVDGQHIDPHYAGVRDHAFIVVVNCTEAASTCFCTSMDGGPRAENGFDLALTEIMEGGRHEILVEPGSERGREIALAIGGREASEADVAGARALTDRTASSMERRVETEGLPARLMDNLEHPHWDDVADRCLACANCTMVCPTCFCSTVEDVADLSGDHSDRWRHWDSCFTAEHSYVHGGHMRPTIRSRYRQWLTHKFATWVDQFGSSGCVGCGRCISWCPAGIDLTKELAAVTATAST